jgi:hypothetical protein
LADPSGRMRLSTVIQTKVRHLERKRLRLYRSSRPANPPILICQRALVNLALTRPATLFSPRHHHFLKVIFGVFRSIILQVNTSSSPLYALLVEIRELILREYLSRYRLSVPLVFDGGCLRYNDGSVHVIAPPTAGYPNLMAVSRQARVECLFMLRCHFERAVTITIDPSELRLHPPGLPTFQQ